MTTISKKVLALSAVLTGLACVGSPAQALDKVSVRMDWVFSGYHAPFFVGVDKGYYRDEGLDVSVEPGSGSGSVAQAIGNGNGEFAAVDGGTMMNLVSKGLKVRAVMGILQRSPLAIVFEESKGIKTPKDLEGKTLGVTPGEAPLILLPAVFKAAGVDESKVTLINADAASKDAMMLGGKVDSTLNFGFLAIPPLEAQGLKVGTLNYADIGVNVPGLSIIASTEYLEKNPDIARRFLKATVKAYEYSIKNPEEAVDILIKSVPSQKIPEGPALRTFQLSLDLLDTEATKGTPLGVMAESDWANAENILAEYQGMEKAASPNVYFTNEYLPAH